MLYPKDTGMKEKGKRIGGASKNSKIRSKYYFIHTS